MPPLVLMILDLQFDALVERIRPAPRCTRSGCWRSRSGSVPRWPGRRAVVSVLGAAVVSVRGRRRLGARSSRGLGARSGRACVVVVLAAAGDRRNGDHQQQHEKTD